MKKALIYAQYGCGLSAPAGWRSFDSSPTLRLQRVPLLGRFARRGPVIFPENVEYGDVIKGLPLQDESCAAVYCSHVLEHLALADLRRALNETNRVMAPAGVFRLVVPDLEHEARAYIADKSPEAALRFMRSTRLGKEDRRRSLNTFIREWLGGSQHLWMWDFKSMAEELRMAGFQRIRRASFGDADDVMFREIEDESRWIDCLGIECQKTP